MITIDPGVSYWAWAAFDKVLVGAGRETAPTSVDAALLLLDFLQARTDEAGLIENPVVRYTARQKGDQADIRDLAGAVGRYEMAAVFAGLETELIIPERWKSTVAKGVMCRRVHGLLSPNELPVIRWPKGAKIASAFEGKGVAADVVDAIGIGLWKTGRLPTRRTR